MPRTRTKTEVVLHRVSTSHGTTTFAGPELTGHLRPEDMPDETYTLTLREPTMVDLGHPDTITVTIVPGDLLNS